MAITSIFKRITPVALLAALLYAPPDVLERYLGAAFVQTTWQTVVQPTLKALVGLGILNTLNTGLSAVAANNWRISSTPPGGAWDWPNEIAVVTGGCSGIGLALVQGLTARGVRVAVLDIQSPPPALAANAKATFFQCDVTSLSAVLETAAAVRKQLGADPSILVNNAGIANSCSILDKPEATLHKVFDVNLKAMWFTVKAFLPAMIARNKGHVFTVASLASFVTLATSVEYSATKAGALAFHEGLACEIKHIYKAPGVVTSVVHPDFVRTAMTTPHAAAIEKTSTMMTVDDVANPILAQIFSGRGAQVIVPQRLTVISTIRAWPTWLQEMVRDLIGHRM